MTTLDLSHKIRIEIPHKMTCLPAPPLFSDLQWWLERSERRATEDMTSVGTEDIWRHLGGIWEVGGIWRPSESGGLFSIIKMQGNRRDRPFYRRVAKVGGTKYRKTHGFRAEASRGNAQPWAKVVNFWRSRELGSLAARNPTGQDCLGNFRNFSRYPYFSNLL